MSDYVLQHVHSPANDMEDVKFIGVYSSRENAQAAITRLSRLPGFSEAPNGFQIDDYQLDKNHWTDGYSSLTGGEAPSCPSNTTEKEKGSETRRY